MKKLVLAMAVMFASVTLFAQADMNAKKMDRDALIKKQVSLDRLQVKTSIPKKSYAENTFSLCDFSDPTAYTFGVTENHSSINTWTLLDGTTTVYPDWYPLVYWRSDPGTTEAAFATWVDGFEPTGDIPMSVLNGFAGFNLRSVEGTDQVEAFVKINTPIHTTGEQIDIHFVQLVPSLWNSDKYYIDWSTDPNFAAGTYDSVDFNIKNVDGYAGDYWGSDALIGRKYVNIPAGTSICDITTPDQDVYVRFRVTAPAPGDNIAGLYWFIDDVAYGITPANRLDVLSYSIDDGYRVVPEILIPEPFRSTATISNTGSSTAEDLMLANSFYSVTAGATENDPDVYTFIDRGTSDTVDLANEIFTIYPYTGSDGNPDLTRPEYIRYKDMSVSDYAIAQSNEGAGVYAYTADLIYRIDGEEFTKNLDTSYYYVYPEDEARSHCYTWQKDLGILYERASGVWDYHYNPNNTYVGSTQALSDGYRVCAAFTAQGTVNDGTNAYLAGIEVVPAVDSCEAGAVIKGSLWKFNNDATAYSDAVVEVLDNEENPVESLEHTVLASELNNSSDPNNSTERFSGSNLNTIFLPFTYTNNPMEDNTTYYACYTKVGNNGKFYLGKDYDGWTSYSYGSGWSILVWSANMASSQSQYDWGYLWFTSAYSQGSVPMIRMVVSDIPNPISSINEVSTNATSYMNAYPNPATDNMTLSYSLNQRGNVTLTVTDLMGRTVISRNEGNRDAGVAYKSNVDVSALNNGTYFYTIEVNGVKSTNKLVINR